jgi:type IV fimbrial biogenesis protein FimT
MENKNGFTLIELIIVIALLAILSAIAIPSFYGWRNQTKLRDAIETIKGDIEVAKSRAIRENDFVSILINYDGYQIFIDDGSGGGTGGNWVRDGDETVIRNRVLTGGVVIDLANTTLDHDRTGFNGRGYPVNTGVITLSYRNNQRQIDMNNRFGRININ